MTLHFLSGLPRSGSTVLAALLNQHPSLHVTPTSSLIDTMGALVAAWENAPKNTEREDGELFRLLRSVSEAKYEHVAKPITIDKSRGWPAPTIMATMAKVLQAPPRIIATVRNVPDCAANFVKVAKPDDVAAFLRDSGPISHLKQAYVTLQQGYEAAPENFLIVDYDDLIADPLAQLARIHAFLSLPDHDYDLNNIDGTPVKERDAEAWNIPGLHDIRPKLERSAGPTAAEVLGNLYDEFNQPAFWRGEKAADRPAHPLDLQKEAGQRGDFAKAREIGDMLATLRPEDNRAAYNRGLYVLMDGRLQDGMALLDRGRVERCFGNHPPTRLPLWDGRTPSTVLLNCEGGLGDQIHGVRYARDIAARGCKVVVSCSAQLAPLFTEVEGVSAVVQHEAAGGVFHEAWVPSMSAVRPLGYEYKHLSGKPYIRRDAKAGAKRDGKFRIGLRWQGSRMFEGDHKKLFPSELFFDAVGGLDVEYVSLQRDEGADKRPEWVAEVPLADWEATRQAVSQCDLVISSCTSVLHLAGAMGVETFGAVPVLPYFLWAPPGERTPHYDSVTLFRQKQYENWIHPFADIRARLTKMRERKTA